MIKKITLYLLFFLTGLTGCKTWDTSMLVLENDPISPKLLTLERRIEDLANTSVVISDDELSLFTKEVETNLIDPYEEKYGYIAFKRNVISESYGLGFFFPSVILATLPNILGVPFLRYKYKIEVEIRILDSDNRLVGKYSAIGKSTVLKAYYYGYGKGAKRKAYTDALIAAFKKIRPQIQSDVSRVNEQLSKAGKL